MTARTAAPFRNRHDTIRLGFAAGHYNKTHAGVVFLAVLILALSAAVANFSKGHNSIPKYWLPFAVAVAIPLTGVVVYRCSGAPGKSAYWLLGFLFALYVAYTIWPKVFSSHRAP